MNTYETLDKDHGRFETRRLSVFNNSNNKLSLAFPYVEQAIKIERRREDLYGEILSEEVSYAVTSISSSNANPKQLLAISRGHWVIENCCNYVKDVTFREDFCRIKDKNGSQLFSALRNTAINLFRRAGFTNIAKAQRSFVNSEKIKIMKLAGLVK